MSWLEGLSAAQDALSSGVTGAVSYARGAIMGAGARAGASGAAVLAALRGAGLGVREQSFYTAWNVVRAQAGSEQSATSIPLNAASGDPLAGPAPENWTGQYTHAVTGVIRERTPDGGYALRSATRYIVSPNILSPADASSAYTGILMTPGTRGQAYLAQVSDLLTTQLTGLWYRTGRLAA